MTKSTAIRILNGALDELNGNIVLRGVIDPETLRHLQRDEYQREVMPLTSQSSILDALRKGEKLPDIELGMRGQRFRETDGVVHLFDPTYIIDGLQRVSGAIHFLGTEQKTEVRLGATIHFGTTKEWERDRFRILNTLRTKVSPNILLRNKREESRAVSMLFGLSGNDKSFVLQNRVSWAQRMTRGELITALTFAKVSGLLHSHKGPGRSTRIEDLVKGLDKIIETVGLQAMRDNIRVFYEIIDECWGIKLIQYREGAAHMKGAFLYVFARLLSDHTDFWMVDDKKLFVSAELRRKIAKFPIHDPNVVNLASSGGKSREMLYMLLRDHINSGKRTKRLNPRNLDGSVDLSEEDEQEGEE